MNPLFQGDDTSAEISSIYLWEGQTFYEGLTLISVRKYLYDLFKY